MAKVKPLFEEYTGTDPLQFAIDSNTARRHDSKSQRAMAYEQKAHMFGVSPAQESARQPSSLSPNSVHIYTVTPDGAGGSTVTGN